MRLSTLSVTCAFGVALAVVATSSIARADIACNSSGECWHTSQRYTDYPASLGIQFHADDWRQEHEQDLRYRWMPDRNPDRGYYIDGQWRPFQ